MRKSYFTKSEEPRHDSLILDEGSRIGVIGGGPAGSFFSYFILQMAQRVGIHLTVDIYKRRDFSSLGPTGCNMCGGVISESLVQALSVEGINLPQDVVQRGIDSFLFHTEKETVNLYAPFREMRIATVYRGGGPKGRGFPLPNGSSSRPHPRNQCSRSQYAAIQKPGERVGARTKRKPTRLRTRSGRLTLR